MARDDGTWGPTFIDSLTRFGGQGGATAGHYLTVVRMHEEVGFHTRNENSTLPPGKKKKTYTGSKFVNSYV